MTASGKWSKREELCLASAELCSGDQNWINVSRSLKLLCGANQSEKFSLKNCAVKYGELLESVETPKRKKRTPSDNATVSNIVENPTDYILRRLTEERIQELKTEIREEQETYAKLYTDVVHLQTGNYNEEQIRAMWIEIEREQDLSSKSKSRKQISDQVIMTQNWRRSQLYPDQKQQKQMKVVENDEDVDKDEHCETQGTSPLLSSLLKLSSPTASVREVPSTTIRVNAPTITNLLTGMGGSMNSVHTKISQTSDFTSNPLLKPLTGLRPSEKIQTPFQPALSPSQSAPTLSMLLEKKNGPPKESTQQNINAESIQLFNETKPPLVDSSSEIKIESDETVEEGSTPTREEEKQLLDVIKNLMPGNIDDLTDILRSSQEILNHTILEEESILEEVESLIDEAEEGKDVNLANNLQSEKQINEAEKTFIKRREENPQLFEVAENEILTSTDKNKQNNDSSDKIETLSVEDSSENALSMQTKEEHSNVTKEQMEEIANGSSFNEPQVQIVEEKVEPMEPYPECIKKVVNEEQKGEESLKIDPHLPLESRKDSISDNSDIISIPTDDEADKFKLKKDTTRTSSAIHEEAHNKTAVENIKNNESEVETSQEAITSICLPDTDEEFSNPEIQSTASRETDNKTRQLERNTKLELQNESNSEEETKLTLEHSKLVEEDTSEKLYHPRRRHSSAQVIDSVPNSPASGDDHEKTLMTFYNNLLTNKNAAIFLRPMTDEQNTLLKQVCRRPMNLQDIKHHIENGTIRNGTDFQRDIFLMCQNIIIVFEKNSSYANIAKDLMSDFVQLKEQFIDPNMDKMSTALSTSGTKVRGSARKCQRLP